MKRLNLSILLITQVFLICTNSSIIYAQENQVQTNDGSNILREVTINADLHLPSIMDLLKEENIEKKWEESKKIYETVLQIRQRENFRGYESDVKFKTQSSGFLSLLQATNEPSPFNTNDIVKAVGIQSLSSNSLKENLDDFMIFYDKFATSDPYLSQKKPQEILNAIYLISYRINLEYPNMWNYSWKFTWIWPICDPSSSFTFDNPSFLEN